MRSRRPGSGRNQPKQATRYPALGGRLQADAPAEPAEGAEPEEPEPLPDEEPPYWRMMYGDVAAPRKGAPAASRGAPRQARAARKRRRPRLVWLLAGAVACVVGALLAPPLLARLNAPRDPIALARLGTIAPDSQADFDTVWERADLAVQLGEARRSWIWGPAPLITGHERYAGAPDGMREVQYYDKGRLELNNPDQPGSVTSGLLVREMVSGRIAVGAEQGQFERRRAAHFAVAGDAGADSPTPTYADFGKLASLDGSTPAAPRVGGTIDQLLERGGTLSALPAELQALAAGVTIATYDDRLGHNIPAVFWTYFEQHGAVHENGQLRPNQPLLMPWESVVGLPLTEPYWVAADIGGQRRWVLAQLFERRVLTFTPDNAPPFQVEMGNTGRHYWLWRYGLPLDAPELLTAAAAPGELRDDSAAISWSSTVPLDVEIHYRGAGDEQIRRVQSTLPSMGAAVPLDELQPGTRYIWRAYGTDGEGNTVRSAAGSFRTLGPPPPGVVGKPVCLTFDDGPTTGTETVLDALGGVPATFFLVGNSMGGSRDTQRSLVERMLRDGYQIANHTLTHLPMAEADYRAAYGTLADETSRARFRENLTANEAYFQELLGTSQRLFYHARLPGDGGVVRQNGAAIYADAARELGLAYVHWNVEVAPNGRMGQLWAHDWLGIAGVAANTAELPPGAIVLLHDAHFAGKGELLRAVIDKLAASGYTFGRLDSAGGCTDRE